MNPVTIIFKISAVMAMIYFLDIWFDGEIDLPHTTVKINYRRAWNRIKKKVLRQ